MAIHVAGDEPQSALLGANAEGVRPDTRGELKLDSIPEAFRIPTLHPNDGEVGAAIPVQIGQNATLLPQERGGLRGQGRQRQNIRRYTCSRH